MKKYLLVTLTFLFVSCGDMLKIDKTVLASKNPLVSQTMDISGSRKLSQSEADAVFTICTNLQYKYNSLFSSLRTNQTLIYQDVEETDCARVKNRGEAIRKMDYFGGKYSYQLQSQATASGINSVDDHNNGMTGDFCRMWNIANPTENYTVVKDGSTYYQMRIISDGCPSGQICFEMNKSGESLGGNRFVLAGSYGFYMYTSPNTKKGFFALRAYAEKCGSSSSNSYIREDFSVKNSF